MAMRKLMFISSIILMSLVLSGCTTPQLITESPFFEPTLTPSKESLATTELILDTTTSTQVVGPEAIAQTMPSKTILPVITSTPDISPTPPFLSQTPTQRLTWTRTPSKTPIPPLASIRITRPGLQSRVLSPFRVEANAIPSPDGLVFLELIGENGQSLYQRSLRYTQTMESVFIQEEVEFSINGVAEAARLLVYTVDRSYRLISLASVDLVLLSIGEEQITPPLNLREPIYIIRPYENEAFSRDVVTIRGMISPSSNHPVFVELVASDNSILFSSSFEVGEVTSDRSYYPVDFTIPFSVNSLTPCRLIIYQESDNRIAGIMALSSQMIYLYP